MRHDRPVTGGHLLALVIVGLGAFLLATIGSMSVQLSRSNAITMPVFQIATTIAAIVALRIPRVIENQRM